MFSQLWIRCQQVTFTQQEFSNTSNTTWSSQQISLEIVKLENTSVEIVGLGGGGLELIRTLQELKEPGLLVARAWLLRDSLLF